LPFFDGVAGNATGAVATVAGAVATVADAVATAVDGAARALGGTVDAGGTAAGAVGDAVGAIADSVEDGGDVFGTVADPDAFDSLRTTMTAVSMRAIDTTRTPAAIATMTIVVCGRFFVSST
jgi:hypothetical protein